MFQDLAAATLVARFGYAAVIAGTLLEGETVVLVAGFLAHQGYLSLPWVALCAFAGSAVSDQGLFFLSRYKGAAWLARYPKLSSGAERLAGKMRSRPMALAGFALLFRFLYGLRNVAPLFLGLSGIPALRFVILNLAGALIWAFTFSFLGFAFGQALEKLLGKLAWVEIGLAVAAIAVFGVFMAWRSRKRRRAQEAARRF